MLLVRAITTQHEREEVYAALQYAARIGKDVEERCPKPKEK